VRSEDIFDLQFAIGGPDFKSKIANCKSKIENVEASVIAAGKSDNMLLAVFLIDGQRYGLEVEAVDRVLPVVAISDLPGGPKVIRGAVNVQGRVFPVVDLRVRFGLASKALRLNDRLLLVRTRRRHLGLLTDEVQGVISVSRQALIVTEPAIAGAGHIKGIVPLPDGLLFLQDLDAVLSLDEEQQLSEAIAGGGA
jgi:purine-binding chemotaxis protein CheW